MTHPPARTLLSNLRSEGSFIATSTLGEVTSGESMGLLDKAHMAVRGAGAHLRPVRRQPRNFKARVEAGLGQHFAQQQHALPAKAGDAHFKIDRLIQRDGCRIAFRQVTLGNAENARKLIERRLQRHWPWMRRFDPLFRPVAEDAERKVFSITSRTQCCASTGVIFQIVGQGDSTSISEKPSPRTWFSRPRLMARAACAICLLSPRPTRSM